MEKTGQIAALMSEKKLVNDGRLLMPVEVRENADVKEVLVLIGTGGAGAQALMEGRGGQ